MSQATTTNAKGIKMTTQYNNAETIAAINVELESLRVPFVAAKGKRSIKWFQKYNNSTGAAYSTSIGMVRNAVALIGDSWDLSRLESLIESAHASTFSEVDAVA